LLDRFGERVSKGERLGLLCRNHDIALTYIYAAAALGVVLVPINIRWTAQEVLAALTDSSVRVVVADREFASSRLAGLDPEVGVVVIFRDGPGVEWGPNWICHTDLTLHYHAPDEGEGEGREGRGQDLHTIMYTSGTTSKPKGVMITHDSQVGEVCRG
jgi:acyl-CoA synthetase (AMP-forming)/AMP-acid ligase II